jgi:hypothetical protein
MTDYYPLIARAVEVLDRSTGEARRALYGRARDALVTQLRSNQPALLEAQITKERLALEEAIRKVEAESTSKSHNESQAEQQAVSRAATSRAPTPKAVPQVRRASEAPRRDRNNPSPTDLPRAGWTVPSARERLLSSRSPLKKRGVKDFGDVVGEVGAAQTARHTREAYEPAVPPNASGDSPSPSHRFEPPEDVNSVDYHTREHDLEPGYVPDDEQPVPSSPPVRYSPSTTAASVPAEAEYEGRGRPLSYGGMARFLVVLSILAGVVATISWQWSTITGLYQHLSDMESKPQTQASHEMPSAQPKFSGLVPQEQNTGRAPGAAAPNGQRAPAVAQRVVFYEEDPNDQQGRRYVGSAIWRTETVSPASGFEPEPAVRADVEIPERRMTMTWSLRRNTDKALAASHTIEITFNLPADFPGGSIANIPGILMKQTEQARGTPLSGLAVKVTNGFFLIGLSAVDTDVQHNVQLLKERSWFDIPIVYANGGRAILAMEKGAPGDQAFAEAFRERK